jgi:catechol 2,3-dioxygenase-like lactoylglutathione lyase family enzyme
MAASYEYIGISVHDLQQARTFYASVFDLAIVEAEGDFPEAGIRTAIIRSPSGLRIEMTERDGSTPQIHLGPHDRSATQGFTHLAVRFAYVSDPEGNLIELVSSAAPHDSGCVLAGSVT